MGSQPWRKARTPLVLFAAALFSASALTRCVVAPRLGARIALLRARAAALPAAPGVTVAPSASPSETPTVHALLAEPAHELTVPSPESVAHAHAHAHAGHAPLHGHAPLAHAAHPPPSPSRLTRTERGWRLDLQGLANPAAPFAGAVLFPSGGSGFVLRALDRAGYLATVGARSGDVLIAVNDQPTLTADQVLSVLVSQQRATAVSLRVRRGSVQYRLTVELNR